MKYKRVEKLDRYYKQVDHPEIRVVPEVGFQADPTFQKGFDKNKKSAQCRCCKTMRKYGEFIKLNSPGMSLKWEDMEVLGPSVVYTTNICVHCMIKLHEEYKQIYNINDYTALYMICAITGVYYSHEVATSVYNDKDFYFDDGTPMDPETHWIDRYFRKLSEYPELMSREFWTSDNVQMKSVIGAQTEVDPTSGMSDEDRDNYNTIWSTYHYDPFEGDDPKDKSRLMADLVTMIDDAMKDDLVRMRAALEIVRAFFRIDKIGESLNQLQSTPDGTVTNANAIKQLTAAKSQETNMVTSFSKDHGFAEKYAVSKSKGSGTLSAVIRDMKESNYDFGTVNYYDIATSNAIKQVSDISAESIFKQVAFTGADYADMVKEQAVEIKRMKEELDTCKEENRLFKEKFLKQELLEELRDELIQKGIPTENVDEMIAKEYNKNRVIPPL